MANTEQKQSHNTWCLDHKAEETPDIFASQAPFPACLAACLAEWLAGWLNGWMDGWLDGWLASPLGA